MRNLPVLLIALLALPTPSTARAQAERHGESSDKAGWRPLFDGRSLDGWEHVGPGRFVVEDGMLRTEGGMGLLWYARETLGDCTLRVVYKTAAPRANSGVYIRIADRPTDEWYAVHHGYEVQIMDSGPEDRRTGSIYTIARATAQPAKAGEWNTLEVTLEGTASARRSTA
jgi:3-keto-disaccharide hydrolase